MSQEQYSVDTVTMHEGTFVVCHAKGVFYILTMISIHVQVCQQCIVRVGLGLGFGVTEQRKIKRPSG